MIAYFIIGGLVAFVLMVILIVRVKEQKNIDAVNEHVQMTRDKVYDQPPEGTTVTIDQWENEGGSWITEKTTEIVHADGTIETRVETTRES